MGARGVRVLLLLRKSATVSDLSNATTGAKDKSNRHNRRIEAWKRGNVRPNMLVEAEVQYKVQLRIEERTDRDRAAEAPMCVEW